MSVYRLSTAPTVGLCNIINVIGTLRAHLTSSLPTGPPNRRVESLRPTLSDRAVNLSNARVRPYVTRPRPNAAAYAAPILKTKPKIEATADVSPCHSATCAGVGGQNGSFSRFVGTLNPPPVVHVHSSPFLEQSKGVSS